MKNTGNDKGNMLRYVLNSFNQGLINNRSRDKVSREQKKGHSGLLDAYRNGRDDFYADKLVGVERKDFIRFNRRLLNGMPTRKAYNVTLASANGEECFGNKYIDQIDSKYQQDYDPNLGYYNHDDFAAYERQLREDQDFCALTNAKCL